MEDLECLVQPVVSYKAKNLLSKVEQSIFAHRLWPSCINLTSFPSSFFRLGKHAVTFPFVLRETFPSTRDPVTLLLVLKYFGGRVPFAFLQVTNTSAEQHCMSP